MSGVSLGEGHTLVVKQDGTVWAAGCNIYGQLGMDLTMHAMITKMVEVFFGLAQGVAAGGGHSMVC